MSSEHAGSEHAGSEHAKEFKALGKTDNTYRGLETFDKPQSVYCVTLTTDEVTALCPITSQPDWYTVEVTYRPLEKCIESKSFKLFMQSLRNEGMFCEALSEHILKVVVEAAQPAYASVKVSQKPRGGVAIVAISQYGY